MTAYDGTLINLPPEVILHIFSFLDVPDLTSLAQISPALRDLAYDPILNRTRVMVVNPSRVNHLLFGRSPTGILLRPSVIDLLQRGVMQGLAIERRWRDGMYIYSQRMVTLYENSKRLQRGHTSNLLSSHLRRRSPDSLQALYYRIVLPESSIHFSISQTLMPTMHKLRWSIQKDRLSRMMREASGLGKIGGIAGWIESKGPAKIPEGERTRLALCPGIRKITQFYERL